MFRAVSTRDKHSRSSCSIKLTCLKCAAEFSSKQKHASHVRRCDHVDQVARSTSTAPPPASVPPPNQVPPTDGMALGTPDAPMSSTSSSPFPPPNGLELASSRGDMASTGGLEEKEDQYSVTFSNELATCDQPTGLKLFDLNSYLQGDVDIDTLIDFGS